MIKAIYREGNDRRASGGCAVRVKGGQEVEASEKAEMRMSAKPLGARARNGLEGGGQTKTLTHFFENSQLLASRLENTCTSSRNSYIFEFVQA